MLNDVLAVGVAGAVVVVIATILGAVELLRKSVAAIAGRWSCLQAWLPLRTRSPHDSDRRTAVMRMIQREASRSGGGQCSSPPEKEGGLWSSQ